MTKTPLETIDAVYAALASGTPLAILDLVAPDVTWTGPASVPWGGIHHGRAGVQNFLRTLAQVFEMASLTRTTTVSQDGMVVTCGRMEGRGRFTGLTAASDYAWVWQVRDGQIARFQGYIDSAVLRDAVTPQPVTA